jgi:hypothetical protein
VFFEEVFYLTFFELSFESILNHLSVHSNDKELDIFLLIFTNYVPISSLKFGKTFIDKKWIKMVIVFNHLLNKGYFFRVFLIAKDN